MHKVIGSSTHIPFRHIDTLPPSQSTDSRCDSNMSSHRAFGHTEKTGPQRLDAEPTTYTRLIAACSLDGWTDCLPTGSYWRPCVNSTPARSKISRAL